MSTPTVLLTASLAEVTKVELAAFPIPADTDPILPEIPPTAAPSYPIYVVGAGVFYLSWNVGTDPSLEIAVILDP
jgi:hypothetical protein